MNSNQAIARCLFLASCLSAVILVAAAIGVGFDGVGDGRWALMGLVTALTLCWFDRPQVIGTAGLARRKWGWRLSSSGLLLALTIGTAWLGPRKDDLIVDDPPVEVWLRNDEARVGWPTLSARGTSSTRVVVGVGPGEGDGLNRHWILTPKLPCFLRLEHEEGIDEPPVGWAVPKAQMEIAGIPFSRRGAPWLVRYTTEHPDRLSFVNDGVSIGKALSSVLPGVPFPAGGAAAQYRTAKPFNRGTLIWSTGEITIRAEAALLLPAYGFASQIPPGSTPLVGLNSGGSNKFMPLVPVLMDDGGQLFAAQPSSIAGEPVAIDLLGEGQSETGPALLENWLREARSRAASAPGLVVVPREVPWRRTLSGSEVVFSRGSPRPSPRIHESFNLWETLLVAVAGVVLIRLAIKED